MSLFSSKLRRSGRAITGVSLAVLLAAAAPAGALAQDGIVARQQQQPAQPKAPETPPTGRTDQPKSDVLKKKEQIEEHGQEIKGLPTEREKAHLPAPGEAPAAPAQSATPGAPAQNPQDTQNPITQPLALSPEVPKTRVGVSPDQVQLMSLQDAISIALQNNLDIEQFRQGVAISQYNLKALSGVYDIVSSTDINYRSQTIPITSAFGGGGSTLSNTTRTLNMNFLTNQIIQPSGGTWQVEFDNSRQTTTSTSAFLSTQYVPTLTLSITQPLMRNFKMDLNRRQLRIAKKALDLSDSQFRQRVIEIINSVQRAYWDLVFSIDNERIARDTVELTRTQLNNNRQQVEAGTLAPIELRSTEAALEARKGDVITALQGITTAENVLKGLLIKDQGDKLWNAQIKPTDAPSSNPQTFNLDEATVLALKNRPELDQIRLQSEQKDIDIAFYKNQTKPQVDFVGFFSDTGVAGNPSTVPVVSTPSDFQVGVVNNLNAALHALNLPPFVPTVPAPTTLGAGVPDRFNGGYLLALQNLFGQDFKTYQFGVRVSFPWRNRTAEGNLGRSLAESRQLDARQRQLVQSVQIDVRNAVQAVEAARLRLSAAEAGLIAARAQLAGEEEKFRAGLSTNFFVLQRQTDQATAEGNALRAKTDYNKALADLQRVTGMTLVSNNINVTADASPTK